MVNHPNYETMLPPAQPAAMTTSCFQLQNLTIRRNSLKENKLPPPELLGRGQNMAVVGGVGALPPVTTARCWQSMGGNRRPPSGQARLRAAWLASGQARLRCCMAIKRQARRGAGFFVQYFAGRADFAILWHNRAFFSLHSLRGRFLVCAF